jgi:DNA invertase Pin-like site-specific DNA recombinase
MEQPMTDLNQYSAEAGELEQPAQPKNPPDSIAFSTPGTPPVPQTGPCEVPVQRPASAYVKSACAYFRTSSATGVGEGKDTLPRQQEAVRRYAAAQGIEIVREFYDAAVSGTDLIEDRPGFAAMLGYMLGNGARTVLVENASRFARDVMVQALGFNLLKREGIALIPVDSPDQFTDESPVNNMMRTIIAAVSQFEREALVLRMAKARQRKRLAGGHWCGRKPVPAATVERARALAAEGLSLRAISAALAAEGMVGGRSGKPYGPGSVAAMLRRGIAPVS